jgi:serine/threonine protein kinase
MSGWPAGTKIGLSNGGNAEIVQALGEGGQGTVYEALVDGKPYALKWYHAGKLKNRDEFRKNLRLNIEDPERNMADCPKFLWPKYLTEELNGSFGYLMELRPPEFTDFPAILNAKDRKGNRVAFKSTETMILAALNLVNAFRALHRKGLSYQDLNDGNFFINPETGEVLICDNDNVTPDGEMNSGEVGGKPGYMAPEIVRGDKHPSERTDCHSLAVVLFKLFFRDNPLQGKEFEKIPCLTEKRELDLFGYHPVFIYDPEDDSNRPLQGVHANVIALWPRFPAFFRDAFVLSFAQGMKDPQKRLVDNDWQKILVRLRDEWLARCPSCGRGIILTGADPLSPLVCPGCNSTFSFPRFLGIKKFTVPLFPGKKLYACHAEASSDDYEKECGEVVMNKNNPALWGIKNLSTDTWSFTAPGGARKETPPGGGVPIGAGVSIDFGGTIGEIKEAANE